MKNFFKRLFSKKNKEFTATRRFIGRETGNGTRIREQNQIVSDFVSFDNLIYTSSTNSGTQSNSDKKIDDRIAIDPKAVFEEIKNQTPEVSFENLDNKIKIVKERVGILKEHIDESHLQDEYKTLFYLENRQKYLKTKDKFPLDWAMTTQEAVDDLCKRYKLKVVALKQYYTLVPKEGVREIDRYTKAYEKITGDKPIIELVIKDIHETKKKDRDPILLANSPLGNFIFVLGAWDDEVEVVDEIIYGIK